MSEELKNKTILTLHQISMLEKEDISQDVKNVLENCKDCLNEVLKNLSHN